jgi:hypothetical protein
MHTTHTTRRKSLQAREFVGAADPIRMAVTFSHLAQGTTPHPPRARVTATPNPIAGKVLKFRVHCGGLSHFSDAKNFDELEGKSGTLLYFLGGGGGGDG